MIGQSDLVGFVITLCGGTGQRGLKNGGGRRAAAKDKCKMEVGRLFPCVGETVGRGERMAE